MAIIHNTTMSPTKLELLTTWLPGQPWYLNTGRTPELAKAGGFRLDDPDGEVGIEFMVVTDGPTTYHVPMTYRGQPLDGPEDALIGTSQHGVLGRRWIYDGTHDLVLVGQLLALLQGEAKPQAQGQSNTPDPSVVSTPVTSGRLDAVNCAVTSNGPLGTDLRVHTADGPLSLRIHRILHPVENPRGGSVSATWTLAGDTRVRGVLATAQV